MSNYVNLLDIVYPVGSMRFSTSSTSPSSIVGGTWEQIKDVNIAAIGDSYKANYIGNKKIQWQQMPVHTHELVIAQVNANVRKYDNNAVNSAGYYWGDNLAGNKDVVALDNAMYDKYSASYAANGNSRQEAWNGITLSTSADCENYCSGFQSGVKTAGGGRTSFRTAIHATYGKELLSSFGVDVNE